MAGESSGQQEADPASQPAVKGRGRRRRRWLVPAVAAVLVVAVATAALLWWRSSTEAPPDATAQQWTVGTRDLESAVTTAGTAEPAQRADLNFTVSSRVTEVGVKVGQQVAAGQVLAKVDDASQQAQVAVAEAAVTAAQDQLDTANAKGDSAAIASARAQLNLKQSQLAQARQTLAGVQLTAPFAGTVAAVNIAVGDTAGSSGGSGSGGSGSGGTGSGGSSGSSSAAAITVISTGSFQVSAQVSVSQRSALKPGMAATVVADGSTARVAAQVASVGVIASASSTGGTATVPVTLTLTGDQSSLFAGASVQVSITIERLTGVIAIPTAAIRSTAGKATVEKVAGSGTETVPVTLGATVGTWTVVTQGLAVGDVILVQGFQRSGGAAGNRPSGGPSGASGRAQGGFPGGGQGGQSGQPGQGRQPGQGSSQGGGR